MTIKQRKKESKGEKLIVTEIYAKCTTRKLKERIYDLCKLMIKNRFLNAGVILLIMGIILMIFAAVTTNKTAFNVSLWFIIISPFIVVSCAAITHYNKDTFLNNKFRYIMLSVSGFIKIFWFYALSTLYGVFLPFISDGAERIVGTAEIIFCCIFLSVYLWGDKMSERYKKKIIRIEVD